MQRFIAALALTTTLASLAAPAPAAVFNPKSTVLPNGLRVIVVENNRAPVVTNMLWLSAGSADEPAGKSGVAHYLEHLMFKATKNHPAGYYSKKIASMGGTENAFTSLDYTGFYATISKDNLPEVLALEADRFANLIIDAKEATPELQVVLDEKRQRVDSEPYSLFTQKMQTLLHPHHPYGTPTIGWPAEIEKLSVEDAQNFYKRWYQPQNITLVVSGDVKAEEVFALAQKNFGAWQGDKAVMRTRVVDPTLPGETHFAMQEPRIREALVELVQPAPSRRQNAERSYALEVLHEMIDGSNAAYLPDTLVNKKGLATSVDVNYETDMLDTSSFAVTGVPKAGTTPDALGAAIIEALKAYAALPFDDKAMAAAKSSLTRQAELARDSVTGPAYAFGTSLATGQTIADVEEWPDHIKAVTAEQVKAALADIIKTPFITGVITPVPGMKPEDVPPPPPSTGAIR